MTTTIETAQQAIAALNAVLKFVRQTHDGKHECLDQVESIQVVHLAAQIAAEESEC